MNNLDSPSCLFNNRISQKNRRLASFRFWIRFTQFSNKLSDHPRLGASNKVCHGNKNTRYASGRPAGALRTNGWTECADKKPGEVYISNFIYDLIHTAQLLSALKCMSRTFSNSFTMGKNPNNSIFHFYLRISKMFALISEHILGAVTE